MMAETQPPQIAPELLEILRCPVAVHSKEYGDEPRQVDVGA